MEEQDVREHAVAYCEALVAGNIEMAAEQLSKELHANLGQVVAMLPMPMTTADVESIERTATGFRAVLHLTGDAGDTRLETRWKDRDGRPVIVEVSHMVEQPTVSSEEPEATSEA